MPLFGPSDESINNVADALWEIGNQFRALVELLKHETRPPLPKPVKLTITSEGEGTMLNYSIVLPAPSAADVTTRTLTVNGVPQEITDLTQTEVAGYSGNDNDLVSVSLVDTDDAGNASPERAQTFTLTDTISPAQPGELGLIVTSET